MCMPPVNERRCYIVTSSLTGWALTKIIPEGKAKLTGTTTTTVTTTNQSKAWNVCIFLEKYYMFPQINQSDILRCTLGAIKQ